MSGPFEGLVGIIENPPDARGRVKILMQLLSRQVRVEVPVAAVDGGWAVEAQIRLMKLSPNALALLHGGTLPSSQDEALSAFCESAERIL